MVTNTDSAPLLLSPSSNQMRIEKPRHLKYLLEFRTQQCQLFIEQQCQFHRPYTCFHWHFPNQRRRRPFKRPDGTFNYNPDVYCDKFDETSGTCAEGEDCPYAHRNAGDTERRYHPRYFKTGTCIYETAENGSCVKNGLHCAFAHGPDDLRLPVYDIREVQDASSSSALSSSRFIVNLPASLEKERVLSEDPKWNEMYHVLSYYKTELCKKPPRMCRQGYSCPFYHNGKDKRRPPAHHRYRSTPCPVVRQADEWQDSSLCEAGDQCGFCHTRTEQQFHPDIYKSTKCNDVVNSGYCPRGPFCAFAHCDAELIIGRGFLAQIQQQLQQQVMYQDPVLAAFGQMVSEPSPAVPQLLLSGQGRMAPPPSSTLMQQRNLVNTGRSRRGGTQPASPRDQTSWIPSPVSNGQAVRHDWSPVQWMRSRPSEQISSLISPSAAPQAMLCGQRIPTTFAGVRARHRSGQLGGVLAEHELLVTPGNSRGTGVLRPVLARSTPKKPSTTAAAPGSLWDDLLCSPINATPWSCSTWPPPPSSSSSAASSASLLDNSTSSGMRMVFTPQALVRTGANSSNNNNASDAETGSTSSLLQRLQQQQQQTEDLFHGGSSHPMNIPDQRQRSFVNPAPHQCWTNESSPALSSSFSPQGYHPVPVVNPLDGEGNPYRTPFAAHDSLSSSTKHLPDSHFANLPQSPILMMASPFSNPGHDLERISLRKELDQVRQQLDTKEGELEELKRRNTSVAEHLRDSLGVIRQLFQTLSIRENQPGRDPTKPLYVDTEDHNQQQQQQALAALLADPVVNSMLRQRWAECSPSHDDDVDDDEVVDIDPGCSPAGVVGDPDIEGALLQTFNSMLLDKDEQQTA